VSTNVLRVNWSIITGPPTYSVGGQTIRLLVSVVVVCRM